MLCHLCNINLINYEVFRMHIMQKHRPTSKFYEGNSDSEDSEQMQNFEEFHTTDSSENDDEFQHSDIKKENCALKKLSDSSSKIFHGTNGNSYKLGRNMNYKQLSEFGQVDNPTNQSNINSNSQFPANTQFCIINPPINQPANTSFIGNLPFISSTNAYNTVPVNIPMPNSNREFDFNSQNITKWLYIFKKLCKSLNYPLPHSLLKKMRIICNVIFTQYSNRLVSKEIDAIILVYTKLSNMIHDHVRYVDEDL